MTSGSQTRKTTARIAVNCTPEQKARIMARADEVGVSPSAICLAVMLDAPLPKRARRRTLTDTGLNAYLTAAQKLTDALKDSRAAMGKSDSNLNQLAHAVNTAMLTERPLSSLANLIESAIEEHRALLQRHSQIFDDLEEIRTLAMEAWGFKT